MIYLLYCIIILFLSIFSFLGGDLLILDKSAPFIFLTTGVWYIVRYRRDSLFCPEFFFFLSSFIYSFFTLIVSDMPIDTARFFDMFPEVVFHKSNCLSLICMSSFAIGIAIPNLIYKKKTCFTSNDIYINIPTAYVNQFNFATLGVFLYAYFSGFYRDAFKYSKSATSGDGTFFLLTILVTALLFVSSICEFVRLNRLNRLTNRRTFKSPFSFFLNNINKLYLFNILFVSFFLLLTGNRNDMMMIFVPIVVLYHFFIDKITNKRFLTYFSIGFCLMFLIGMLRTDEFVGQSIKDNISWYYTLRDFAAANVDQLFLVQYSETHSFAGLEYGFKVMVSSVPFLGGLLIGDSGFQDAAIKNSNKLTTSMINDGGGGMGTSLFGDLYFCGGLLFAILYMLLFGLFIANTYNRLKKGNSIGIVSLVFFCTFFSNIIYLLRSTWYAMFRPIGFSLTIVFLLYVIGNAKKSYR